MQNSFVVACVGFVRASPPNRAGSASKLRSISFGGDLPVRAGISSVLMVCSSGSRLGDMFSIVRDR